MKTRLMCGFLLTGFLGACGGGGTTTDMPMQMLDPQLTLLTPAAAFSGRTVDLQISGTQTSFDATSLVSLNDPGIVISNVAVGDHANLRFTATLATTATLGPHDLTVTTASVMSKLAGGLLVRAPLQGETAPVGTPNPSAAQGSLTTVFVRNLDYVQNPFNTSTLATRFSSGLNTIQSAQLLTGARIAAPVLIDALVPSGATVQAQLTTLNPFLLPTMFVTDSSDPNLPKPTARAATAITANTALSNQLFANPGDSGFYSLNSTGDNQILVAQLSALGNSLQGPNGQMQGAVAPASGRYSDGNFAQISYNGTGTLGTMLGLLGTTGPQFLSIWPTTFSGGTAAQYGYTITPKLIASSRFSAMEPATPDSATTPLHTIANLDATTGYYATDGALDRPGDVDYILYTAAAAPNRVYVNVAAPGAGLAVAEYPNNTCAGAATANSFGSNFAALETVAVTMQHCISISANGTPPRYPVSYKVIIAAQ